MSDTIATEGFLWYTVEEIKSSYFAALHRSKNN